MKNLTIIALLIHIFSMSIFASNNLDDDKKKKKKAYNHMMTAPKIKTAPFIRGLAANGSIELLKEGINHVMLVDKKNDNILLDYVKEGKDFIRIYTDPTDHQECLIIWRIKKKSKKTGKITWRKFTYKYLPSLGWWPVDNMTTKVKSFQ
ncbi:hypothetical protein [Flammeovirga kamogawensis]|uniref:Uncharacterized protein n=1 Tax=Flammeovirga kamogawensis TaxID=373891 RepID=A0ABX8GU63_9BACT|nr:hypothetical protein [Flammeovirga kamogawensis]MBB6459810.1 hypothetical protein [Flammeovirga kamogawensis]QWG07134.1 hypothetical protein KM029_17810 [Flammeovirga kamogawensis]TRX68956.1 hypothetical protein EO216_12800 [Flammeovirga kamogawensis]